MNKAQIVFVGAFILFLAVSAEAQPRSWVKEKSLTTFANPDIILHNANVITLDNQMPSARAIAIAGNRISAVGTDAEVLALLTPARNSSTSEAERWYQALLKPMTTC